MVTYDDSKETGAAVWNRTVMESLMSHLPAGTADVQTVSGPPGPEFRILVWPKDSQAAPIQLAVVGDMLYLTLGLGTTFDIPPGGGEYLNVGQMEELEVLVVAAVQGKFEEKLTYAGDRIVRAESIAHCPTKDIRNVRNELRLACFLKPKKTLHKVYKAYT
jgi:hypothetical protein